MQLCDKEILRELKSGGLVFAGTVPSLPFEQSQIQPASIDLRLGNPISRFRPDMQSYDVHDKINPEKDLITTQLKEGQSFTIQPKEVVFGQIYELMIIGNLFSARVEGKSRIARLGISVHCTGSYINPGFRGAMPLQIVNNNLFPVVLYPFIPICQLVIFQLNEEPFIPYSDRPDAVYRDEIIAGPSVLSDELGGDDACQSIAKMQIATLLQGYYEKQVSEQSTRKTVRKPSEATLELTINNNLLAGGYNNMGDTYTVGSAGSVGPNSGTNSTNTIINNNASSVDAQALLQELERIKAYIKTQLSDDEDADIVVGDVSKATRALKSDRKEESIRILKACGTKLYDIAKSIGCTIIAKIITNQMGL